MRAAEKTGRFVCGAPPLNFRCKWEYDEVVMGVPENCVAASAGSGSNHEELAL